MVMYGWGAMNPTAIKEAVRVGYPMDKFVSIWWPSEDDARGAGPGAKGFKEVNWHAVGADFPAIQDIQKTVVDKGLSKASKEKVGELLYNRGVYNSLLIAEGIRNAQALTGKKAITGEDMRRGLEAINLDAARWKALGLDGPIALSCSDHNGHRPAFLQEWDGAKWVKVTEPIEPMTDRVRPLLDAAAKDYAEKNTGWPKRTEACDKPS
jgi:branched-chain amino acid transport system substrate-binding protein